MGKWGVNPDNNGKVLNMDVNNSLIGMPDQKFNPYVEFSDGGKMRRGANPSVFDNNGGTNKGEAGGVINHNSEKGPITYGF